MQMLHKKFPLNIIAKYVDLSKIDNKEISKIIRNTLSDKSKSNPLFNFNRNL